MPEEKMRLVQFTRKDSWPCPIDDDTKPDEIENRLVKESETYLKDGKRYYDMVCGHGEIVTLPVHWEVVRVDGP